MSSQAAVSPAPKVAKYVPNYMNEALTQARTKWLEFLRTDPQNREGMVELRQEARLLQYKAKRNKAQEKRWLELVAMSEDWKSNVAQPWEKERDRLYQIIEDLKTIEKAIGTNSRYRYSVIDWRGLTLYCANNAGCSGTWYTHRGKTLIRKSIERFTRETLDSGQSITTTGRDQFHSENPILTLSVFIQEMEAI